MVESNVGVRSQVLKKPWFGEKANLKPWSKYLKKMLLYIKDFYM